MSDKESSVPSITLTGLFALLFVYLKLTNYIAWSWWWVLSPLWIPIAVVLVIVVGWAIWYTTA